MFNNNMLVLIDLNSNVFLFYLHLRALLLAWYLNYRVKNTCCQCVYSS